MEPDFFGLEKSAKKKHDANDFRRGKNGQELLQKFPWKWRIHDIEAHQTCLKLKMGGVVSHMQSLYDRFLWIMFFVF